MASFADLSASLKLNINDFAAKLKDASKLVDKFSANLRGGPVDSMKELNNQTNKWGLNLKSVSRVVSGILISQTFYGVAQDIKSAAAAVWDFTSELEYAKIAYSNLFGDTSLANELINVLKDFAAVTPFSFTESEQAAKRLLAYGIEYKNVMYVMKGVMSSAAMQGDPRKVEQISRALGQIYTKGRLMNEEMRQLAEAGIPAYEILREKLGLTQKQLQNLGNESIPASKAINALVDGMTERFGTTMEASSKTLKGIISNIKDNATMLFAGIFEPLTTFMKSGLNALGEFLFKMRDIYELKGLGGVFEAIVPKELQSTLRQAAANVLYLLRALRMLLSQGNLLRVVIEALLRLFNAFAPIVANVATALSAVINAVTSNTTAMKYLTAALAAAAAMWVVFKVKALASIVIVGAVQLISKAIAGLSAALSFIVAHPVWALLIGLTGILVGISGGFGKVSNAINGMFNSLTKISGIDPNKLLLPSQKDRANDLDKFNNKLNDTSDAMDELADSTGKANKAAKSLLSFDEVFRLNQPDEGTDSGIDTSIPEIEIPDFGLGNLESYVPEIPDFSDYFQGFGDTFLGGFGDMWEKIKDRIMDMGIGALIGSALGSILGGPLGAKIGAIAGTIAGWFWDDLKNALGMTDTQGLGLGVGAVLGAAIGKLIGHPLLGTAIGSLVGWLIGAIKDGIETGDWSGVTLPAGAGIAAAIGGIVGGPTGAAIGAAIGLVVSWILKKISELLGMSDVGQIALPLSTIIGAGIGLLVGGPPGAAIGAAIGALVGWLVDGITKGIENGEWSKIALPAGIGIGAAIGALVGGPAGAAIGAAIGALVGWITQLLMDYWGSITDFFSNAWNSIADGCASCWESISTTVSTWWTDTKTGFSDWWTNTKSGFSAWWTNTKEGFSEWASNNSESMSAWSTRASASVGDFVESAGKKLYAWFIEVKDGFADWSEKTGSDIAMWSKDVRNNFNEWAEKTGTKLSTWWSDIKNGFSDWSEKTGSNISAWWKDTKTGFADWKENTGASVATWVSDVKASFTEWKDSTGTTISTWVSEAQEGFTEWKESATANISSWLSKTIDSFANWSDETQKSLSTWWNNTKKSFTDWCTSTANALSKWFTDIKNNIKNWWHNAWSASSWKSGWSIVSQWFSDLFKGISNWFSNIGKSIGNWWDGLWSDKKASVNVSGNINLPNSNSIRVGHATGGIFNREHVAKFAEGNKAEAVIPLENASAMQPFVDAISKGIIEVLTPTLLQGSNSNNLPPLYVGTLIADDRGLQQLYKKFEIIQVQENARRI